MLYRFPFLVFLCFFFACQKTEQGKKLYRKGEKEVILYSLDYNGFLPIAKVRVVIPKSYNVMLSWRQYSCTGCSGSLNYTFMSDRSNAYLENGFAGHSGTMEDSLERFNIRTGVCSVMYLNSYKVDSLFMEWHKERNKWNYDSAEYVLYVGLSGIKYLRVLSDIKFYKEPIRKEKCWKKLEYITSYKGQYVSFEFECRKEECDDFKLISQEVVNSVIIEDLLTYTTSWK